MKRIWFVFTFVVAALASADPAAQTNKLFLSSSLLGASGGRTRAAVDDIAIITFTAGAGDLTVNTVTLNFTGSAVSQGVQLSANLIDADTNANWGLSTGSGILTAGADNSVSHSFSPQFALATGASKQVKVRVDSSGFFNAPQTWDSLSVTINSVSGVTWSDGASHFNLEEAVVPFTVVNVSYR